MLVARWKYSARARFIAFALAAAFIWICTGGTLRHSDDCVSLRHDCIEIDSAPRLVLATRVFTVLPNATKDSEWRLRRVPVGSSHPRPARRLHRLSVGVSAMAYEAFAPALCRGLPSVRVVRHASLRAPPAIVACVILGTHPALQATFPAGKEKSTAGF